MGKASKHDLVKNNKLSGVFVRPYAMFAEEINPQQYPEATQKYRFELVK